MRRSRSWAAHRPQCRRPQRNRWRSASARLSKIIQKCLVSLHFKLSVSKKVTWSKSSQIFYCLFQTRSTFHSGQAGKRKPLKEWRPSLTNKPCSSVETTIGHSLQVVCSHQDTWQQFLASTSRQTHNTDLEPETTGLSAYLNFGALSVRTLWHNAANLPSDHQQVMVTVHGQLLYREFFYCAASQVIISKFLLELL